MKRRTLLPSWINSSLGGLEKSATRELCRAVRGPERDADEGQGGATIDDVPAVAGASV